ncbi:MAG: BlaI/MecI/CopY family transcriptional regulator [Chloroflexota bacterium]
MVDPLHTQLSRRESQIMDVIFQLGEATAVEIMERLPDPPSNSSVRTLLTILEQKGHLTHRREGGRFIYAPSLAPEKVKRSALSHLMETFFGGSVPKMVATLLSTNDLSESDLDELTQLIEQAKKEEKEDDSLD